MRAAFTVTLIVSAMALSSCGTRPDRNATGSIPDDYRTRHPIVLTEDAQTLDIPIATGDRSLTTGVRDNIRGFAADHAAKSRSAVQIAVTMCSGESSRMACTASIPSAKANPTPSNTARAKSALPCWWVKPQNAPLALGLLWGVRSPER